MTDPGAISAYERVLCSTFIYKCAESFCRVSLDVCVCVYDEAKNFFLLVLHAFQCNYPKIVQGV